MWRNIMRLTKSKKVSVLHYSIDNHTYNMTTNLKYYGGQYYIYDTI